MLERALANYTRLIDLPEAPVEYVAQSLLQRGLSWGKMGAIDKELADYARIVGLPGAPVDLVAQALWNRGLLWKQVDEIENEMADWTQRVGITSAPRNSRGSVRPPGSAESAVISWATLLRTRSFGMSAFAARSPVGGGPCVENTGRTCWFCV